jgi:RNA polymerase sigma-70 factor (ECF subfamily)
VSHDRQGAAQRSDEELATLALQGSAEAWSEIARRHTRRVVVSLLARGMSLQTAEDLTQEAWIRLMQRQREGGLRSMRLPGLAVAQAGWLAREESRTRLRREAIVGVSLPLSEATGGDEPVAPDAGPEQTAVGRECLEMVVAELRRCPSRAQQVFREVYGPAEASHADVARRLGLSVQRVRQIVCEVRARLRRALEDREKPWNT